MKSIRLRAKSADKSLGRILAALSAATALASPSAHAASASWLTAGDGNWVDGPNWSGGAAPGAVGTTNSTDTATFNLATSVLRTIAVDATRNVSNLTFSSTSSAGYTLSGGSLWLTSGGQIQNSGNVGTHTDRIDSQLVIQGNGGTYTFGANSLNGSSNLVIATGGISGVSTAGNVTTLTLNGGNQSAGNNVSAVISDGSAGGRVAVVKGGNGAWTVSGSNTFSGGFTLSGGNLRLGNALALGSGTFTIGGGGLSSNGTTLQIANNMIWNATVTHNNTIGNSGSLVFNGSALLTGNRDVNVTAGASSLTVNGSIGDNGSGFGINKTGSYSLILGGSNTFTGTTNVNQGTVTFGPNGSLAAASTLAVNAGTVAGAAGGRVNMNGRNITVAGLNGTIGLGGSGVIANVNAGTNSVLTVDSVGNSTYNGVLIDAGSGGSLALVKSGTGTLTLAGSNNYTGGTTVTGGTLVVNGGSSVGTAYTGTQGVITGNASGNFTMTGLDPSVVAGLVVGQRLTGVNLPATGTYITSVNTVSNSITFSSYITGTNSATQSESALAYVGSGLGSGNVTVSGGELVAGNAGALAGAGTLLISGGSVSSTVANANVGGHVNMTSGNLSANGSAAGSYTLAANRNFSLSGGAITLTLGLGSGEPNGSDQFLGSGTGTFSLSDLTIAFDLDGGFDYNTAYNLLSGFQSGAVSNLTFTGYDTANWLASIDTAGVLTFTAVPEPAGALLFGAGACVLLFRRRRQF